MTDKRDESRGDFSAAGPNDQVISDRVQELTWALLDEQITDDEFMLLDNLLLSDDKARGSYLRCVQLHADLMTHFAAIPGEQAAARSKTPVLGFLTDALPPIKLPSSESLK